MACSKWHPSPVLTLDARHLPLKCQNMWNLNLHSYACFVFIFWRGEKKQGANFVACKPIQAYDWFPLLHLPQKGRSHTVLLKHSDKSIELKHEFDNFKLQYSKNSFHILQNLGQKCGCRGEFLGWSCCSSPFPQWSPSWNQTLKCLRWHNDWYVEVASECHAKTHHRVISYNTMMCNIIYELL